MNYLISDNLGNIYLKRDKILELRDELIKKYTKVVSHYSTKQELLPNELHHLRTNTSFTGYETLDDLNGVAFDFVSTYNEYQYPEIVYLINDLLRGDRKTINKIHDLALNDDEMSGYYKILDSCIALEFFDKRKYKNKRLNG